MSVTNPRGSAQRLDELRCRHSFGQEVVRPGERRTLWVAVLTAVTMLVEIAAGLLFGSIALLADGLHMASHTAALGIAVGAYIVARRLASDRRFSFGTGKVNALAGFTSALMLAGFAALMAWESLLRFIQPVEIAYQQALGVATLGLVVNAISALILASGGHDHGHAHHGGHGHAHSHHGAHAHDHDPAHETRESTHRKLLRGDGHRHGDHNLRAAYLHVLADALTSVLAIVALLGAWLYGWVWLDPVMGIVGALLVGIWSWNLVRETARVLLDREAPDAVRDAVVRAVEDDSTNVADLHMWSIGPGIYALILAVRTPRPRPPEDYKARLPADLGIVHPIIEVRQAGNPAAAQS